ncbi:MAG TPA: hypothetical protein VJ646_07320, partial [Candidatus Binatia bacterium]|nr:hypothetical protein [Candidatus Binatia bacterium]
EPGTAQLKFIERCKSFPIGTLIRFEMHDLAEVCNFMLDSIRAVAGAAVQYARSVGVSIQEKD